VILIGMNMSRLRRHSQPGLGQSSTLTSGGQPLAAETRAIMEPRFGFDFGQIRIFSGDDAMEGARGLGAEAYTMGTNIVFGAGQYAPDTEAGQRLLAHELTHVVQQSRSQGGGNALVSQSSDAAEREADNAARHVASGSPVPTPSAAPAVVSRSEDEHTAVYWLDRLLPEVPTDPIKAGAAGLALAKGLEPLLTNPATVAPTTVLGMGAATYSAEAMQLDLLERALGTGQHHTGTERLDEDAVNDFMDKQGINFDAGVPPVAPGAFGDPAAFLPPGEASAVPELPGPMPEGIEL
jgi:hypothetical protein